MRLRFSTLLGILFLLTSGLSGQVRIIFDTDFGGDADDLGALVMLHQLQRRGECELLGIASWSTEEYVIPAMDAVNRFYGNPEIPMGIRSHDTYHEQWNYSRPIAEALPHRLTHRDVPSAVELYRKILSAEPDASVTVVTVGPLGNIRDLLESGPDDFSELSGSELVHRKAARFVIMGGHFPEGRNEWNFNGNMPGVTRFVLESLRLPIVFTGFEVGAVIKTGTRFSSLPATHPLRVGYRHFSEHAPWMKERFTGGILDNASFDQTAVLYAVRGGLGEYWDLVSGGKCIAEENGDNRWDPGSRSSHSYLVLKSSPEKVAEVIYSIKLQ